MSSKMNENEMKQIEKKLQTLCSEMETTKKDIASSMADIVYEKNHDTRTQQIFDDLTSQGRRFVRDMNKVSELHSALLYCINATVESEEEACNIIGNPSSDNNTSSSNGDSSSTTTPSTDKETSTDERIGILEKYRAKNYPGIGSSGVSYIGKDYLNQDCLYYRQKDIPDNCPSIRVFNDDQAAWISCTFMTMSQLHSKGLGFPFYEGCNTNGVAWYNSFSGDSSCKYGGKAGFQSLVNEYLESGQEKPLENIVLSFSIPGVDAGHVMLIDNISKGQDGQLYVTFKDNNDIWAQNGYVYADSGTIDSAIYKINNMPFKTVDYNTFLNSYTYGMTLVGAVLLGSK